MQEEQSITSGPPKRESSGPVACGENEDSSRARGELRGRGRRGRSPSGNLDLWGLEDSDENFVHSSQQRPVLYISSRGGVFGAGSGQYRQNGGDEIHGARPEHDVLGGETIGGRA